MNNYTNYNAQLYNNFSPKLNSKTQPHSFYNQNNQSQSSNNKISYNPNIISNQNYIPNFPSPKNPIKWRNINKINLPHLKSSRDINILQSYLDNLICGQITEEDIQTIQENSIVKLIQILQTMSDILLNEQAELENEKLKLESNNLEIMKQFQEKDKLNLKNKETIRRLKKDKKRDIGVINTYLNVINNLKQGSYYSHENINITDIEMNQKQLNDINTINNINNINNNIQPSKQDNEFKCQFCTNKLFSTEFELTKHLDEFHGIKKPSSLYPNQGQNMPQNQIQILKPEVTVKIPDNFYGMNNTNNTQGINNQEIINEMKNMQQQFYNKMQEEKILLQKELNERTRKAQQSNLNYDLNKLENTFKETIDSFKQILQQKENNVLIEESEDDEEDLKKLEEIKILKEQLEKEKINLEQKKSELQFEDKKYQSIFIEINQTKKYIEDDYIKKINNTSFSNNMQIQPGPEKIEFIRERKKPEEKKNFNSGKIMPDHDDTEEELERNKEYIES